MASLMRLMADVPHGGGKERGGRRCCWGGDMRDTLSPGRGDTGLLSLSASAQQSWAVLLRGRESPGHQPPPPDLGGPFGSRGSFLVTQAGDLQPHVHPVPPRSPVLGLWHPNWDAVRAGTGGARRIGDLVALVCSQACSLLLTGPGKAPAASQPALNSQ